MTTKLTLSVDEEVVVKPKPIAKTRRTSVSELFEEFINSLSEKDVTEKTSVDKIKKIMKGAINNPNINWKKAK